MQQVPFTVNRRKGAEEDSFSFFDQIFECKRALMVEKIYRPMYGVTTLKGSRVRPLSDGFR